MKLIFYEVSLTRLGRLRSETNKGNLEVIPLQTKAMKKRWKKSTIPKKALEMTTEGTRDYVEPT